MNARHTVLGATLLSLAVGCSASTPTLPDRAIDPSPSYYAGGDGSSTDEAVLFPAARSSIDGVPLESRWLGEHIPGYHRVKQRLLEDDGRRYDVLDITTPDGDSQRYWFDVTSWFGMPRDVAGPF